MKEGDWRGNRSDNRSGVTINNLGKASILLLAAFSGAALGIALFAYIGQLQSERRVDRAADEFGEKVKHQQEEYEKAETRYADQLRESERETRMLEYYLLELDAKAIAAGIKRPEDAIANKLKKRRE